MKVTILDLLPGEEEEIIVKCNQLSEDMMRLLVRFKQGNDKLIVYQNGMIHRIEPGQIYYFESVDQKVFAYCEKEGRQIPVMGLPGCVMYAKRTIFDLVLPRIMCDEKLHEKDFRLLGQGGLCLSCPVCTFPNCGFGKGGY